MLTVSWVPLTLEGERRREGVLTGGKLTKLTRECPPQHGPGTKLRAPPKASPQSALDPEGETRSRHRRLVETHSAQVGRPPCAPSTSLRAGVTDWTPTPTCPRATGSSPLGEILPESPSPGPSPNSALLCSLLLNHVHFLVSHTVLVLSFCEGSTRVSFSRSIGWCGPGKAAPPLTWPP